MMRNIIGLEQPTSGTVRVRGVDIQSLLPGRN